MSLLKKISMTAGVVLAAGTLVATEAAATEGYFQNALGARSKGMAGAGVANSKDATAITLNPAGLVHAGRQFNGSVSLFMPFRSYSAGAGAGGVVPGSQKSKRNIFAVPNMAYSQPINDTTTFGVSLSGNGGMNTTYKNGAGPFGGGTTGIDLTQVNISAGFGKQLGKYFSFGVAPIFAIQRFKARGLGAFDNAIASANPGSVTNRGYDYSVGGGVRFGVEFQLDENIRVGASYQSKLLMSRFKKYSGLFAENGDFDIPSNFQVGVAFDVTPDLTLMVDYRYIHYSEIAAISNHNPLGKVGTSNGSGFG
ncbi:MAG: outer membrane protein transport protein, partial [Devosiaceae bacterium]|nr:outer membrane protein transport protein [Devosiaceae bacterium]